MTRNQQEELRVARDRLQRVRAYLKCRERTVSRPVPCGPASPEMRAFIDAVVLPTLIDRFCEEFQ